MSVEIVWSTIISGLLVFLVALVVYSKHALSYWKRRGVPSVPATIPLGNMKDLLVMKKNTLEVLQDLYDEARANAWRHIGIYFFLRPIYLPRDPEIIKRILQSDFDSFTNRGFYYNERDDPLSGHLFTLDVGKWKPLRQKFTQTFTSGQMKIMFQTLTEVGDTLEEVMEQHSNKKPLDARDTVARFTTDIIASCAFGIKCNTLVNPDTDFRKYGRLTFANNAENYSKVVLMQAFSANFLRALRVKLINNEVSKFFKSVVYDTIKYREENNVYRKDFMHLLLQLKNRGRLVDDKRVNGPKEGTTELSDEELAAQAFVFYIAGFETSSAATSFALYELALNQKIQDKVRDEIDEVLGRHGGKVTYEAVMEMKYMHQVVEESLRKYPPLPVLDRDCVKDYKIPGTEVVIEKGTHVQISAFALHRDPDNFPNPEYFDPDRFSDENKKNIKPFTYLPFGEGPRICIGLRFGIIQTKVALCVMLRNFRITLNEKTKVPLKLNAPFFNLGTSEIWVNVEKITV